jgi:hypothetical protein
MEKIRIRDPSIQVATDSVHLSQSAITSFYSLRHRVQTGSGTHLASYPPIHKRVKKPGR